MTTDTTDNLISKVNIYVRPSYSDMTERNWIEHNRKLTKAYVAYRASRYQFDKIHTQIEELIEQGSITVDILDASDSYEESALNALTSARLQMEECEQEYDELCALSRKLSDALNNPPIQVVFEPVVDGDK